MKCARVKEKEFGTTKLRTAVLNKPYMGPGMAPGIPNRGCWYFEEIFQCPGCGAETVFRERKMPPKPDLTEERYRVTLRHCGCTSVGKTHHIRLPNRQENK